MGDYESLYPNAIILANLGIDSVLEEASMDSYKINLNFVDKYLIEEVLNKVLKGIKLLPAEENLLNLDNNPKWVYFSKNSSLYALIVKQVLEQRLATKALMGKASTLEYEQLDARQNALKIMVNTIYGLSGCKTF
jgi:DNA polymerase elongation subunit (family B)